MSRLRRLAQSRRVFFLTTHFLSSALPLAGAERNAVLECIPQARQHRHFQLLAYCVMPSHLHVLLIPRDDDTMANVMREIKIRAAKEISRLRGRPGKLWQARSFDRIIRNRGELSETMEYIHLNPVRAGFVKTPGDWQWSSWRAWQTRAPVPIPIDFIDLPIDPKAPLRW